MARTEPLHAVVVDGVVEQVIVVDAATATEFASFEPPVFPGAQLIDVTGRGVGQGWTYDGAAFTAPAASESGDTVEPTPETPTAPDAPSGDDAAGIAELRAVTTAQQESIDWLTDVVTTLAVGGEIGGGTA